MTHCQYCGEASGSLPFKCNYCGGTFCGSHRLPENHECSFDENYQYSRAKEREKEKERTRSRWVKERDLGIKGTRSTIGTSILYIIIISMSILGAIYPEYLTITDATFYSYPMPFTWTFFTSIFVVPITNVAELSYFLILLFFSYYFVRTFENRFGPKVLIITYLTSASILVIVHIFSSSVLYYYWFVMFYAQIGIGLAPGGLIGLMFVILVENTKRSWYFRKVRLRAITVLIIVIVASIVSKVITTMIAFAGIPSEMASFYYSESVAYYWIDIVGPIVVIIIAAIYFQVRR